MRFPSNTEQYPELVGNVAKSSERRSVVRRSLSGQCRFDGHSRVVGLSLLEPHEKDQARLLGLVSWSFLGVS